MTTETATMPFRCAACGPIDCVNLVEKTSVWWEVHLIAGIVTADGDTWQVGEDGGPSEIECASCGGDARMADGSRIVVGEWM